MPLLLGCLGHVAISCGGVLYVPCWRRPRTRFCYWRPLMGIYCLNCQGELKVKTHTLIHVQVKKGIEKREILRRLVGELYELSWCNCATGGGRQLSLCVMSCYAAISTSRLTGRGIPGLRLPLPWGRTRAYIEPMAESKLGALMTWRCIRCRWGFTMELSILGACFCGCLPNVARHVN